MKLLIYSDLHLNAFSFQPDKDLLDAADVVVLAGDIDEGIKGVSWAAEAFVGKPVLYVPGNHEFYEHHRPSMLTALRRAAFKTPNVQLLDNDAVEIDGTWFLGATLWTDYELFVPDNADRHARSIDMIASMNECRRALNDYKLIYERVNAHGKTAKAGLVQPYDLLEVHRASRAWLQRTLTGLKEKHPQAKKVVITHHAPAPESLGKWYAKPTSPAYASNLPAELMGGADLWIHGHIHAAADYHRHGCRVLANPRGYPDRKSMLLRVGPEFDNFEFADLLIDISEPGGGWPKRFGQQRLRAMSSSKG